MTWITTSTSQPPAEGESVTVTLSLPSPAQAEVVANLGYSLDGFSIRSLPFLSSPPATIIFAAGESVADIVIPTQADGVINTPDTFFVSITHITQTAPDVFQPPEPQELTLVNVDTGRISHKPLQVTNLNEDPPTNGVEIPSYRSISLTIILDIAVESDVSVNWSIANTSEESDSSDYTTSGDNPLVFPANSPPNTERTIKFTAIDDTLSEDNEQFAFLIDSIEIADPNIPVTSIDFSAGSKTITVLASDQRNDIDLGTKKLHSCELTSIPMSDDMGLMCWGNNYYGQLGDGSTVTRYHPVMVTTADGNPLSGVVDVSTGYQHTCALVEDENDEGDVYCWGRNNHFQIGQLDTRPHQYATLVEAGLTGVDIAKISAGGFHTCTLSGLYDNRIRCWGLNYDAQTGEDDPTTGRLSHIKQPTSVGKLIRVLIGSTSGISAGGYHTCFYNTDGGTKCWGRNSNREAGTFFGGSSITLSENNSWISSVKSGVSAGRSHSCGLDENGIVYCWGSNSHGQLGSGTIGENYPGNVPAQVLDIPANGGSINVAGAKAVSAGHNHTCIITSNDQVRCWGSNGYGQLGVSTLNDGTNDLESPYSSVKTGQFAIELPAGTIINRVQANTYHTCAWSASNRFCWGLNSFGSVANGYFRNYSATPVQVTGISGASSVIGGASHSCVTAGSANVVQCWGNDEFGQLGRQVAGASTNPVQPIVTRVTRTPYSVTRDPISQVTAISAGSDGTHTCVITNETEPAVNEVICWGGNQYHQSSPNLNRNAPRLLTEEIAAPTIIDWEGTSHSYSGIAAGNGHTCILVEMSGSDDEIRCWGSNDVQQIGSKEITNLINDNGLYGIDQTEHGTLGKIVYMPKLRLESTKTGKVGDAKDPTQIVAGSYSSCMVTDEPGWVPRFEGEGPNRTLVTIAHGSDFVGVADPKGDGISDNILCWGDDQQRLDTKRPSARIIHIRDRSRYRQPCLPRHSLCTPIGHPVPRTVDSAVLTGIETVVMGSKHSCAVGSATGEVYCWGNDDYGQLAYDLTGQSSQYAQKVLMHDGQWNIDDNTYLTNVGQLSAGRYHTCALIDNVGTEGHGDVYCWGKNDRGQLGNIRLKNPWFNRAVKVEGLPGPATGIGGGSDHTCAIMASDPQVAGSGGEVYCWGSNLYGQIGDSSVISEVGEAISTPRFEFDIGNETISFARSQFNRAQLPQIVGGSTDNLWYQVVAVDNTNIVFPEGLAFEADSLSIVGTPAYGIDTPMALKYQALDAVDNTNIIAEVSFMLDIDGDPRGSPTISRPIANSFDSGNGFLLFTAANQSYKIDLSAFFSDGQNTIYCSDTVTTACLDFTATSADSNIATVSVDEVTKELTITSVSVGQTMVTVVATDADSFSTVDRFLVKYNTAPTLTTSYRDTLPETLIFYRNETTRVLLSKVFNDSEVDPLHFTINSEDIPFPLYTHNEPIGVSNQVGGWSITLGPSLTSGGPYGLELCATDTTGSNQQICTESELYVVDPLSLNWIVPTTGSEDELSETIEFTIGQSASVKIPEADGGAGNIIYSPITIPTGFTWDAQTRTLATGTNSTLTSGELIVRAFDANAASQLSNIEQVIPKTSASQARTTPSVETESISNCAYLSGCIEIATLVNTRPAVTNFSFDGFQNHIETKVGVPLNGVTLPTATKANETISYCLSIETNCPDTFDNGVINQDGLTFDLSTLEVSGVPIAETEHTVLVLYASDGNDTITLPFSYQVIVNAHPEILTNSYIIRPDNTASVTIDLTAEDNLSDPDDQEFTCTISRDTSADTTEHIVFTADTVDGCRPQFAPGMNGFGSDTFTLTISDGLASDTVAVTVYNNNPPVVINPIANLSQRITTGAYSLDLSTVFADVDSTNTEETQIYSIASYMPANTSVTITGTTLTVQPPTYPQVSNVSVCLTDAAQEEICDQFEILWHIDNLPDFRIDDLDQDQLNVETSGTLRVDLNDPKYVFDSDNGDSWSCSLTRVDLDEVENVSYILNGCIVTFSPNETNGWGPDQFKLFVADRANPGVSTNFTVYHNNPPVIVTGSIAPEVRLFNSGDYTLNVGTLFEDVDVSAGSGDVITITKGTVTPPDLAHTYDRDTGILNITVPTDTTTPLTHSIEFCAEDIATDTICGTVEVRWTDNSPPDIKFDNPEEDPLVVQTGGANLELDLTNTQYVEDADGETITCNSISPVSPANPPHITVDLNNCDLTFSTGAGGFGSSQFNLEVSDGTIIVSATFTVWQSAAPELIGATSGVFDQTVTIKTSDNPLDIDLTPKFGDADIASGDALTYSVEEPSSGLTHQLVPPDNNTLRITPPDTAGTGQIDLCATDLAGLKTCGTLNLNFPDNQPPTLKTGTPEPITVSVINGTSASLDITTYYQDSDNNDDELSWTVTPTGATDQTIATATPDSTHPQTLNITGLAEGQTTYHIAATDGIDSSGTHTLEITVTPNSPPELTDINITQISIRVGVGSRQIPITDYYQDTDTPDHLAWEVNPITGHATIADTNLSTATADVNTTNPMLLDITGIAIGDTSFHVRATDGPNTTTDLELMIQVVQNDPPSLISHVTFPTSITQSHNTQQSLTVTDYYQDINDDTLSWTVTPITMTATETGTDIAVATATPDPTNPTLLIIEALTVGTSVYHLAANDGLVQTENQRLEITVTNQTPTVVSGNENDPINVPLTRGTTRNLNIADYYTDPDDNQLTWTITPNTQTDTNIATAEVDTTNNGLIRISTLTDGTTQYDLTASDGVNTTPTRQLVITVTAPTPPPTGGGGPPGGNIPGGTPTGGNTPTQPAAPTGDNPFGDDDGNTHEANINLLAQMGISRGCNPPANTRFCPDRAVTRGEMATFMVRAFTLADTTNNLFDDDNGTTHETNINRLATAEITRGCNPPENSRYCPQRPVTRAQMATFIARALNLDEGSGNFTDTANTVHANDINRIASVGITRGCNPPTNTRYCPERPVTRAEMATFLIRATNLTTS